MTRRLKIWVCAFLITAILLPYADISQAFGDTAKAASLTVTIRQVNPNSAPQTVTCTLLQKNCDLSLVINAGTAAQQSVNVHVVYLDGGLALNFKSAGGYFSTASTIGTTIVYTPLWSRRLQDGINTFSVALFQPLAPTPFRSVAPDANYTAVSSLEITATSSP